jgi:hypothetical protein
VQLIDRGFPLDMRELTLVNDGVAHDMFINEKIGVVDGLDLGVLVFVDILEEVQLTQ